MSHLDLADTIANMNGSDAEVIAKMVSDALQEDIQLAIFTVLNFYFESTSASDNF
jgi:hypothetical protein